jgi:hypothetical protein
MRENKFLIQGFSGFHLLTSVLVFIITTINVFLLIFGSSRIGNSWDEAIHVRWLQVFFDQGWYTDSIWVVGPSKTLDPLGYTYGPVSHLIGHFVGVFFGAETFGQVSYSAEAYQARHLGMALIGVLGILASGAIAKLLFGGWVWFWIGTATVSSIPVFLGHSMFNPKDAPVASGMLLFMLGLLLLLKSKPLFGYRQIFLTILSLALGTVLTVGTRPGMWLFLAGLSFVTVVSLLFPLVRFEKLASGLRVTRDRLTVLLLSLVFAYFILFFIYPKFFSDPIRWISFSVSSSQSFPWMGMSLTAGVWHESVPPFWYIPAWLLASVPAVMLVFAVIGAFIYVFRVSKFLFGVRAHASIKGMFEIQAMTVVFASVLAPPIAAIVLGSVLYDGIRLLLFIIPPIGIITLYGLKSLVGLINIESKRPIRSIAMISSLVLLLVQPTVDSIRIFPYQYTYYSSLTLPNDIKGLWPTDYWRVSIRESLLYVDKQGTVYCDGHPSTPPWLAVEPWVQAKPIIDMGTCASSTGDPWMGDAGSRFTGPPLEENEWHWVSHNRVGVSIPENCAMETEITRQLRGQELVIGWVARCTEVVEPG